jgi:hypothetical protein
MTRRDVHILASGLDVLVLHRAPEQTAQSWPAYEDEDGDEWAVNHVVIGDGVNDACERCGDNIQDKAFSVFPWGMSELRCSDCVRFVDGARPPRPEDDE